MVPTCRRRPGRRIPEHIARAGRSRSPGPVPPRIPDTYRPGWSKTGRGAWIAVIHRPGRSKARYPGSRSSARARSSVQCRPGRYLARPRGWIPPRPADCPSPGGRSGPPTLATIADRPGQCVAGHCWFWRRERPNRSFVRSCARSGHRVTDRATETRFRQPLGRRRDRAGGGGPLRSWGRSSGDSMARGVQASGPTLTRYRRSSPLLGCAACDAPAGDERARPAGGLGGGRRRPADRGRAWRCAGARSADPAGGGLPSA